MYEDKLGLKRAFSKVAQNYDLLNHCLSFNLDKGWRKKLVDEVPLPQNAQVLDVCTGTADVALAFARKSQAARITGVDFSGGMLARAREKIDKMGLGGRIRLVQADMFDSVLEQGTFDVVSVAFGLRNIADTGHAVARMAELARPGGTVAILEMCPVKNPVLAWIHALYTKTALPLGGMLVSGAFDEYRYLSASIQHFFYPEQLCDLMASAGLTGLRVYRLSGGIACVLTGLRPGKPDGLAR